MMETLGNIGDFIGGIGVIFTLLYLAVQIRQNTRSHRLNSVQQVMGTSVSINLAAFSGPVPSILTKLEKQEQLSEDEFAQLLIYNWAMMTNHWQVFHQFNNGMLDEAVFNAYRDRLKVALDKSVSRAMWRQRIRQAFPADFRAHVETHIESNGG